MCSLKKSVIRRNISNRKLRPQTWFSKYRERARELLRNSREKLDPTKNFFPDCGNLSCNHVTEAGESGFMLAI